MLRVAELIRHALAELLSRGGIQDPILEASIVTVPRVKMSPDLKLATVFVLPLGGKDTEAVLDALDKHRKFLRGEVARRVNLKSAPELRFKADDSFDNAAEIDALFRSEKVRQDLSTAPAAEAGDEPPAAQGRDGGDS